MIPRERAPAYGFQKVFEQGVFWSLLHNPVEIKDPVRIVRKRL